MPAYGFVDVGGPEQQAFLDVPGTGAGARTAARARAGGRGEPGGLAAAGRRIRNCRARMLGREAAGTVLALGPDVTGFAPDNEVLGGCPGMVGGWADEALVDASFASARAWGSGAGRRLGLASFRRGKDLPITTENS